MNDPYKIKDKSGITVHTKFQEKDKEPVEAEIYVLGSKEYFESKTKEEIEEQVQKDLNQISLSPVSGIYNFHTSFQYDNEEVLKDFDYGNTVIQVNLPFVLHIPNEFDFEIELKDNNIKGLVTTRKIWTNRANSDGIGSSEVDLYCKDNALYFKNSNFITPKIPMNPKEGWEPFFTGQNVEKIKDKGGVFRFTQLYIEIDTNYSKEQLENDKVEKVLKKVKESALKIVNKLIDAYRLSTKLHHITRLGNLNVSMVYFKYLNTGFYTPSMGFGIETAPINRSYKEIQKMRDFLESDDDSSMCDLLILDSLDSFELKNYSQSVLQSFQALEIKLEQFIFNKLIEEGQTEDEVNKYLNTNWMTKTRLKDSMKKLTGSSLQEYSQDLWDRWCTNYDKVRNEVIHRGYEPEESEVGKMLNTNKEVYEWISTNS
jgi:hypothetical protein